MDDGDGCTVIVTVDAPPTVLGEMRAHAEAGIELFPRFEGFAGGHLRMSEDATRLVQHVEWRTREAYVRCRDDPSWDTLPTTRVFERHVASGAATVDARVFRLVATSADR